MTEVHMSINVWSYQADFAGICENAALATGKSLSYPGGNLQGQAGWDVGVEFKTVPDLTTKLGRVVQGPSGGCGIHVGRRSPAKQIARLAIMAHGDQPGVVQVSGKGKQPDLTGNTVGDVEDSLRTIGNHLQGDAIVLFMSCIAGAGTPGTFLLRRLSEIWPGRRVVGFSTTGYIHGGEQYRKGEACTEPGVRDTGDRYALVGKNPDLSYAPLWKNLQKMPWFSEMSPNAKVVLNSRVLQYPVGEVPPAPAGMGDVPKEVPPAPAGMGDVRKAEGRPTR
jgi:hypothetical protein